MATASDIILYKVNSQGKFVETLYATETYNYLQSASGSSAIKALTSSYVGISNLTATGTPSATTYLRGDNTWATITSGIGATGPQGIQGPTGPAGSGVNIVGLQNYLVKYDTIGLTNSSIIDNGINVNFTEAIIGTSASFSNDIYVSNFVIGSGNSASSHNYLFGYQALQYNTTGTSNVAIGYQALQYNTTGFYNVGIGEQVLTSNNTGYYNIGIGYQALFYNTNGFNNIGIGFQALLDNLIGTDNIAIGNLSMSGGSNSAVLNIGIGNNALRYNQGTYNIGIGHNSLQNNSTGGGNVAIGYSAGFNTTTGGTNVFLGWESGYANTTGASNVFIGNGAGSTNISGTNNTFVGFNAGNNNTTGSYNTIIGNFNALGAALNDVVVLADGAGQARYYFDGSTSITTIYSGYLVNNNVFLSTNYVGIGANAYNMSGLDILGSNSDLKVKITNNLSTGRSNLQLINNAGYITNIFKYGNSSTLTGLPGQNDFAISNGSAGRIVVINNGIGVYLSQGNTSWTSTSDERSKADLVPIETPLEKINKLRSLMGRFITDPEGTKRPFLIAQDVQQVLPEAIDTGEDEDQTLGLRYLDLLPLLVGAINELSTIVLGTQSN